MYAPIPILPAMTIPMIPDTPIQRRNPLCAARVKICIFPSNFSLYEDAMKRVWNHKFLSGSQSMTSTPISTSNMIYPYEQNDFWMWNGVKGWLGDFQWGLVETNTSFVNSKKSATNMFCSLIFGKLLPLNIFGIGLFFPNVKFLRVKIKNILCSMKKIDKN